ncbi:tyrosine-type recombinase/integrase [Inhella sp.]|uniref:tyrosine-type recombinase/integrase n=1 Tax=Inhella sp. TaxID=1921806 RepID=UPI0035B2CDC8
MSKTKPKNPSQKLPLTEAVVAKFKCPPDAKVAFMWDTVQRGLGVRVLPDHMRNGEKVPGAKTWVVQGRVKGSGVERRITLGPVSEFWLGPKNEAEADAEMKEPDASKVSAREQARRMRVQMKGGLDPVAVQAEKDAEVAAAAAAKDEHDEAQAWTLRAVAERYVANKKTNRGPLKPNTIRDINEAVDRELRAWADKPIASITEDMCKLRHEELATRGLTGKRPAPHQARGAFVILGALINYTINKIRVNGKRLMTENPVDVLKGEMAPPRKKTIKVPMDRIGHVWEALRQLRNDPAQFITTHTQADALAFMLLTGARKEEAMQLTWDRIELGEDAGSWHLPDPKNGLPITLPLSAPARALLKARPRRQGCDWVFQRKDWKGGHSTPRGPAMAAVIAAAGCHLDRHALRRTMTSLALTVLDIPLWKVELLTGHKLTGNVTLNHYTETSDLRYLAPEAERIGAWIVEQGNIAAGRNVVTLPDRKRA